MLEDLETLVTWTRMMFKLSKSKNLVLIRGRVDNATTFKIGGEEIPILSDKPSKSLGLMTGLKDTVRVEVLAGQTEDWIQILDYQGNTKHGIINIGPCQGFSGNCLDMTSP